MSDDLIGFIGQGWIGKNYADSFTDRGYDVVRYALEKSYSDNEDRIQDCDIVFIAVPTPTTSDGFNFDVLKKVVPLVGMGKMAIIKSTILPGTTEILQRNNSEILVMHSPEFLEEAKARHDSDNPLRNIIGIPVDNDVYREAAKKVMSVLPKADYELISDAKTAG